MPRSVYLLALGVFAMVTSEFAVAGLMPQLAAGFGVTVSEVGYLITAFGLAMSLVGPVLAVGLLRTRPKNALLIVFAVFLTGNVLAAVSGGYTMMLIARVITGAASQAFFGLAVSLCVRTAAPEVRGRAIAVVMNGLMLGTLLGLPLATVTGEALGWRAAFWAVSAVTVIAAAGILAGVPDLASDEAGGNFRAELRGFAKPKLWLVFATSTCIIGATFAAFSYFSPILTDLSGFGTGTVPLLLVAYGAATLVGNTVVGRLADRFALPVLASGLALNILFLAGFALLAHLAVPAVLFMLGIGLVGVTMNPAMVTRVQRVGNARPLLNTVHSSFITFGVVIGSSVGGLAIPVFGLRGPLWLGALLAVLGVLTLVPDLVKRSGSHRVEDLAEVS
ncbi:MFS transporter [Amycolatopsis acidicola]|uniref:MFS transporter n=1 Tax=Amycolatopsis acidicola TaxID=2596893 RepID=A0A5N0UKH5_9PSEU|nr:MFS transporter [Amycolatopsis acidicola]KAA9150006.1 MFS transporter [Amycolatopsis acidicola]